jgi:hypothetical protein
MIEVATFVQARRNDANMGYRGTVKGNVVILDEGVRLPEGLQVDIVPVEEPRPGSPAALLEVWGSDDVPDDAWDTVEEALEELDRTDKEQARQHRHA